MKSAEDALLRFHYASRGVTGRLAKLRRHTSRPSERRRTGDVPIDGAALEKAYDAAFDDVAKGWINPFSKAWKGQAAPPMADDVLSLTRADALQ